MAPKYTAYPGDSIPFGERVVLQLNQTRPEAALATATSLAAGASDADLSALHPRARLRLLSALLGEGRKDGPDAAGRDQIARLYAAAPANPAFDKAEADLRERLTRALAAELGPIQGKWAGLEETARVRALQQALHVQARLAGAEPPQVTYYHAPPEAGWSHQSSYDREARAVALNSTAEAGFGDFQTALNAALHAGAIHLAASWGVAARTGEMKTSDPRYAQGELFALNLTERGFFDPGAAAYGSQPAQAYASAHGAAVARAVASAPAARPGAPAPDAPKPH